jgi:rhamnogalacturonan endolyase
MMFITLLSVICLTGIDPISASRPFFLRLNDAERVIGNHLWNITIGPTYRAKLFFKDRDMVRNAQGHYLSYSWSPFHST